MLGLNVERRAHLQGKVVHVTSRGGSEKRIEELGVKDVGGRRRIVRGVFIPLLAARSAGECSHWHSNAPDGARVELQHARLGRRKLGMEQCERGRENGGDRYLRAHPV